jgi:diketogulonate reductase-like aldo/keto reductase
LAQRDPAVIPIPGTTKQKNVDDIAGTLTWQLTSEEHAEIDRASAAWT